MVAEKYERERTHVPPDAEPSGERDTAAETYESERHHVPPDAEPGRERDTAAEKGWWAPSCPVDHERNQ